MMWKGKIFISDTPRKETKIRVIKKKKKGVDDPKIPARCITAVKQNCQIKAKSFLAFSNYA